MKESREILDKYQSRFFKKVWIVENQSTLLSKITNPMIPDGCFELALVQGNGIIININNTCFKCTRGVFLCGQGTDTMRLEVLPESKVHFLKLYPWITTLLSKFQCNKITDGVIPFSEINKSIEIKLSRFNPTTEIDKILNVLDYEMDQEISANRDFQLILHSCNSFYNFVDPYKDIKTNILSEHKISLRTLENKFNNYVGLTPKQYALLIKLRKISEDLYYKKNIDSYTALSFYYGYFDQSHFIRTFKSLFGSSPKKIQQENFFIPNSEERFRYYTI